MSVRHIALLLAGALAACVTPAEDNQDLAVREVRLNETARFGDVAVTPLRVVEDSRCAVGVQCIQAGTVRISARVRTGTADEERLLALGVPADLGGAWASLVQACPYPVQGRPIRPGDYLFILAFRRDGPLLVDAGPCR